MRLVNAFNTQQPDITGAMSRLASAFFSGPSPAQTALMDARIRAADQTAALSRTKQEELQTGMGARSAIAELFAPLSAAAVQSTQAPETDFVGPRTQSQAVGEAGQSSVQDLVARIGENVARGGLDPAKVFGNVRGLIANTPGTTTEQLLRSLSAVGGGAEDAIAVGLSPEDQRTMALGAQAFGPSRSSVEAGILSLLSPEDQRLAVLGREPQGPNRQARIAVFPNGNRLNAFFDPASGENFLEDGTPVPADAQVLNVPSLQGGTDDVGGNIGKAGQNALDKQIIQARNAVQSIDEVIDAINEESGEALKSTGLTGVLGGMDLVGVLKQVNGPAQFLNELGVTDDALTRVKTNRAQMDALVSQLGRLIVNGPTSDRFSNEDRKAAQDAIQIMKAGTDDRSALGILLGLRGTVARTLGLAQDIKGGGNLDAPPPPTGTQTNVPRATHRFVPGQGIVPVGQ